MSKIFEKSCKDADWLLLENFTEKFTKFTVRMVTMVKKSILSLF